MTMQNATVCGCRQGECDSAGGKDRLCRMAEAVRAKVLGVGRDAENAKTLVVYFDKEPNDYDLRRTHDLLRSNVEHDRRTAALSPGVRVDGPVGPLSE